MKEKETFVFRVKGKWTIDDMSKFLHSVNQIYNAFYALEIKRVEINKKIKYLAEYSEDYYHYWKKHIDHPLFEELWYIWDKIMKDYILRGKPYPLFLMPWFYPFFPPELSKIIEIDAIQIYKNIDVYRSQEEKLFIRKINIKSLGIVSFEGVGEIIQQIREFIKDIWYRNRQERQKGEIELRIKKIEYAEKLKDFWKKNKKYGRISYFVDIENELTKKIIEGVSALEDLEKDGKLEKVPENIDYEPEI